MGNDTATVGSAVPSGHGSARRPVQKRVVWRAWGVIAAFALLLSGPFLAAAQQTTLPPSVTALSREPVVIAGQLRMAADLGRRALAGFQAAGESGPLDEAVQLSRNTYVLIRVARAGLDAVRQSRKFQDPLLDYAYQNVTDAWNLARTPGDRSTWGHSRAEYLHLAIRDLSQAISILEQVLVVMP